MHNGEASDEKLVEQAVRGDPDAYRLLVERHKNAVFSIILKMVRHRQTAEDLAQEVFLKIYRGLDGFRQDAKFSTWLYRVTVYLVTDYLRSHKKKLTFSLMDHMKNRFADRKEEPEEQLLVKEQSELLSRALDRIPEKYRMILVLYHYRQMSYQEIADVMQMPLKTVETRLYRGRSLLKKQWLEVQRSET